MAQTNINIRIDENLKKEFDNLCQDLGLTMTTAFTVFVKTAVRRQGIPFEIAKNMPNAETISAIEESQAIKKKPSLGKSYTDVDAMMKEFTPMLNTNRTIKNRQLEALDSFLDFATNNKRIENDFKFVRDECHER